MSDSPGASKGPKIRPLSQPMEVPVFNCVIYVMKGPEDVQARVANLADLKFVGKTEPDVLRTTITEVKRMLSQWHSAGEEIPWLNPHQEMQPGEEVRYLPVHL